MSGARIIARKRKRRDKGERRANKRKARKRKDREREEQSSKEKKMRERKKALVLTDDKYGLIMCSQLESSLCCNISVIIN
jgi:hypothetical protein